MKKFSDLFNFENLSPKEKEEAILGLLKKNPESIEELRQYIPELLTLQEAEKVMENVQWVDLTDFFLDEIIERAGTDKVGYLQCTSVEEKKTEYLEGLLYFGPQPISSEKLRWAWNIYQHNDGNDFLMLSPS